MKGVGDNTSAIVGKLVNVPLCLGESTSGMWVKTTFYILECSQYHFILGLPLLSGIDGAVHCSSRRLSFRTGPHVDSIRTDIQLCTRTQARESSTMQEAT